MVGTSDSHRLPSHLCMHATVCARLTTQNLNKRRPNGHFIPLTQTLGDPHPGTTCTSRSRLWGCSRRAAQDVTGVMEGEPLSSYGSCIQSHTKGKVSPAFPVRGAFPAHLPWHIPPLASQQQLGSKGQQSAVQCSPWWQQGVIHNSEVHRCHTSFRGLQTRKSLLTASTRGIRVADN